MKKLLNKFDILMSAVTFAEAGEHDTAREIMKEGTKDVRRKTDEREYNEPAIAGAGHNMAKG